MIRHYSLANDWRERDRYVLGVARAARSGQRAAFLETLQGIGSGSIHLHADDRADSVFDPVPWLAGDGQGEHVYCCGLAPMMASVAAAVVHRAFGTVHFEYFSAPETDPAQAAGPDDAFTLELRRERGAGECVA